TPAYRAFAFTAAAGDEVDIWVKSTDGGDALAWLVDAKSTTLAKNNDAAPDTKDARIHTTLKSAGTYDIAFRDLYDDDATFVVSLRLVGTVTNAYQASGGDCSGVVGDALQHCDFISRWTCGDFCAQKFDVPAEAMPVIHLNGVLTASCARVSASVTSSGREYQ